MRQVQTTPEMIKNAPKVANGYSYALGSWVIEEDNNRLGTVITCPGLFGTWPVIDYCKGYTCLNIVKTLLVNRK